MKKHCFLLSVLLSAALVLTACSGGAAETTAAAKAETTAAAKAEAKASQTAAAKQEAVKETEKQKDSAVAEAAKDKLTEDGFYMLFDMLIEDMDDPDSFFVEYGGKKYDYDALGDLYEDLAAEGGKGTVKLMGEYEEDLDFEAIAGMLVGGDDGGDDSDPGSDTDSEQVSEEGFIRYFDMMLEENGVNKDDFFVEYGGRKYWYDELGELYAAAVEEGGTIDVNLMGEAEEMLDLEIMAGYLSFMEGWNSWETGGGLGYIDQDFIDRFSGDWHGMLGFRNCTGKYESVLGNGNVTSIARFIIDSDGYVVPFIGVHVEETPIMDLEATLDPEADCMYLSGSWINVRFENIPMTEENGTLHAEIPIAKDTGSFTMVFNFRHLNDIGWTSEDPALPEDYITHCQGWSFDKLAESNGYANADYPHYSAGEEPVYEVQIQTEAETEDFGKTMQNADGVVSMSTLQAAFKWLNSELDKAGHEPLTYERIRDQLGADGKKVSPAQWTAESHKYEWCTDDGKQWMDIFFKVNADGSEIFYQVNPSSGLTN